MERVCCMTDCILNAMGVLTSGKVDNLKAAAAITKVTVNNTAWTDTVRALATIWKMFFLF